MSDTSNPSSADALAKGAAGIVRAHVAQVAGNSADKQAAQEPQQEWDASHSAGRLGPVTVTSDGAVHIDNEDRRQGQWKQTVGSAKESTRSLIGSEDLKQSGRDQFAEGQAQSTVGKAADWIQGSVDRLRESAAMSSLLGHPEDNEKNQKVHDEGKAAQRSADL